MIKEVGGHIGTQYQPPIHPKGNIATEMIKLSAFIISLKTNKDKNARFVIIFQVCLVLCSVVGTLFPSFFLFSFSSSSSIFLFYFFPFFFFSSSSFFLLLLLFFFIFSSSSLLLHFFFFFFSSSSFFFFSFFFFLLQFVFFFLLCSSSVFSFSFLFVLCCARARSRALKPNLRFWEAPFTKVSSLVRKQTV